MKDKNPEKLNESAPTRAELDVLQVLWKYGPSTVRFVHDKLNEQKEMVQYTSTLKLMQVMAEKGMLTRDTSAMKHIYSAALEEKRTKGKLLSGFVDSIYGGSVTDMMVALLGTEKTSDKEMKAIKEMLKKLDEK
jgi:BlaI family penicillinase repressor